MSCSGGPAAAVLCKGWLRVDCQMPRKQNNRSSDQLEGTRLIADSLQVLHTFADLALGEVCRSWLLRLIISLDEVPYRGVAGSS